MLFEMKMSSTEADLTGMKLLQQTHNHSNCMCKLSSHNTVISNGKKCTAKDVFLCVSDATTEEPY